MRTDVDRAASEEKRVNELALYDFRGQQIKVVAIDGKPWFVAADVCAVLGYRHTGSALRSLRDREKVVHRMHTLGGEQDITVISEPGLYRLIMRSNREQAEDFQDWVTEEVLPSIRETGSYGVANSVPQIPDMNTPEGQLQVAELLASGARKQIEQAAEIKVLKPKAEYVDAYVDGAADATILRIVAKQLQVGEKWLRALLLDKKIVARRIVGTRWSNSQRRNVTQYQWYARSGYEQWFVQRDQPEAPRLHNGQMQTTLYVTPVGKVQIASMVTRAGEAS
jgi:anti-repressor protein